MDIGIIFMDPKHMYNYLPDSIQYIGCNPVVFLFTKAIDILIIIKNSPIKYWIFSGSNDTVIMNDSPQIPIEIFDIPNKEFLMICYSMESTLFQFNYPIKRRYTNKNEDFKLKINMKLVKELNKEYLFYGLKEPLKVRRNHQWYIKSISQNPIIINDVTANSNTELFKEVASYRGESMMIFYKNAILVQYHPERTIDGVILMKNWVNNKTT